MKILVIQLARLGDIYLTWPSVRALRRQYPQAEIHILVRSRFSGAVTGLESIDRLWHFPSQALAEDLLNEGCGVDDAKANMRDFIANLRSEEFQMIVNLSFSPLSSYLTHSLTLADSEVRGYSRQADGFLSLPDDASSYFYAQVGPGRVNRYHLGDLFAEVAGVSLRSGDWAAPWNFIEPREVLRVLKKTTLQVLDPYVLLHVGASQQTKCYPLELWCKALNELDQLWGGQVLVVGSFEETEGGEALCRDLEQTHNWCGRTSLPDLFALAKGADIVVGADSLLMHIATMTETPCLNLSSTQTVKFWETGPRSEGSRILLADAMDEICPHVVCREIINLLSKKPPKTSVIERVNNSYLGSQGLFASTDFSWNLVQAIYAAGELPVLSDYSVYLALTQLNDLCKLALTHLQAVGSETTHLDLEVIQQADQLMDEVARRQPEVAPLVSWFKAELVRIGPNSVEAVKDQTLKVYRNLELVLSYYCLSSSDPARSDGPKLET